MKAHDFLTVLQYNGIREKIFNQQDFNFKTTFQKKYSFVLDSSHARWESETVNEGDYIVLWNVENTFGGYSGGGGPLEKSEFEDRFSSYRNALRFIDRVMSGIVGEKYELMPEADVPVIEQPKAYVQMSFF